MLGGDEGEGLDEGEGGQRGRCYGELHGCKVLRCVRCGAEGLSGGLVKPSSTLCRQWWPT